MSLRSILSKSVTFGIFAMLLAIFLSYKIFAAGKEINIEKCWESKLPDVVVKKLYLDRENAYVTDINGKLTAFSVTNGEFLWSTDLGGPVNSNLVDDNVNIFLVTGSVDSTPSSFLKTISKNSGLITKSTPIDAVGEVVLGKREASIFVGSGSQKAAFRVTGDSQPEPLDAESVFVAGDDIVTLNNSNLIVGDNQQNRYFAPFTPTSVYLSADKIYWGDVRGNVTSQILQTRSPQWQFKTGAGINDVELTEKGLLAASQDNFIYLLSSSGGNVIWKVRVEGRVSFVNILNNDVIVINSADVPEVQFIDLSNGRLLKKLFTDDIDIPIYSATSDESNLSITFSRGLLTAYAAEKCVETKKDAPF